MSKRTAFIVLASTCLATAMLPHPTMAQSNCLRADSSTQRVSGNLMKLGSEFILKADGTVCLTGSDPEDNKKNVATIHLYTNSDAVRRQLARSVGRYFEVVGRPFGAITQHHKAPIVMEVREVVFL